MSYQHQRTVEDGETLYLRDDILERDPAQGPLIHANYIRHNIAAPIEMTYRGMKVHDIVNMEKLDLIYEQLRILNQQISIITEVDAKEEKN